MSEQATIKTALITGAARRIGREMALALAADGWDIALHYHTSEQEVVETAGMIEHMGCRTVTLQADLAVASDVSTLLSRATDALGAITCLIHNASLFEKDNLLQFTDKHWQRHMAINAEAPLHLTRDFVTLLPPGEPGQVICLLDGMQGWSVSPHFLSYSLSKLTLANAVELLAAELAPQIRINGIALGATLPGPSDGDDVFERLAAISPLQRHGDVSEVIAAMRFLLSAHGMTGQILDISNGMGLPRRHASVRASNES